NPGDALVVREVAGDGSVQVTLLVGAQKLVVVVRGHRVGDWGAVDEYRATFNLKRVERGALVVPVGAQLGGLHHLNVGDRSEQHDEHRHDGAGNEFELFIHARITSFGRLRTEFDRRNSSATII